MEINIKLTVDFGCDMPSLDGNIMDMTAREILGLLFSKKDISPIESANERQKEIKSAGSLSRYESPPEKEEVDSETNEEELFLDDETDLYLEVQRHPERYVYGMKCIEKMFSCSPRTAQRIYESGRFGSAIIKNLNTIIVDVQSVYDQAIKTGFRVYNKKVIYPQDLIDKQLEELKETDGIKYHPLY